MEQKLHDYSTGRRLNPFINRESLEQIQDQMVLAVLRLNPFINRESLELAPPMRLRLGQSLNPFINRESLELKIRFIGNLLQKS